MKNIVLAAAALAILCFLPTSAFAAPTETVYETGFEVGDAVHYNGGGRVCSADEVSLAGRKVKPLDGKSVWYAEMLQNNEEFKNILTTDLHLAGNAIYEAEFSYRILDARDGGHLFAFFSSPTATWADAATGYSTFMPGSGKWEKALIRGVVTPLRNDYELSIFACGKVEVALDSLRIRRVVETPLLAGVGTSLTNLPPITGAKPVRITPPRENNGPVLSVADYGASTNSEDNTAAFKQAIADCRSKKAKSLVVPTGVYRFTDFKGPGIGFANNEDLVFDGQGSTFVFYSQINIPAFIDVTGCTRCVFKNFKIDWDYQRQPLASHAVITKREGGLIELQFVDYQSSGLRQRVPNPLSANHFMPLDNNTFQPGRPYESGVEVFENTATWKDDSNISVQLKNAQSVSPRVGDHYVVVHNSWGGYGIYCGKSPHLLFENVSIFASKGFGFYLVESDNIRLDKCRVVPNPEAQPRRYISTSNDGYDVLNCLHGDFVVENCEFSHTGDDFINLNTSTYRGLRYPEDTNDPHVILANPGWAFQVGERVDFRHFDYSPAGFTSTVTARQAVGNDAVRLTFADPVPRGLERNTVFFTLNREVRNFIIRSNYFHNGFVRGILPNGSDATIEGNTFASNCMPDMLITVDAFTPYRIEGKGISNLLIRNNQFLNSNYGGMREASAAIYVHMWKPNTWYPIQGAMAITNNTFINPAGACLFTASTFDLRFTDNTIRLDAPHPGKFILRGAVVLSTHSSKITVARNRWLAADAFLPKGGVVYSPAETREIAIFDNQFEVTK